MSVKELVRSTTTTPGVDDFSSTVGTPLVVDRTGKITYFLDSSNNVVAINGGGWTAAVSQGDLFYGSAANTIANLAKSATASYLDNSGSSNNPAWAAKAALTRVDDTNVTLTLGGTPTTSLLTATSITVGWSGTLAPTRGGTGLGSYTSGDIIYASAANTLSALAKGTDAEVLTLVGGFPSWETVVSDLVIGNPVTGGTNNRFLYIDASGNLAVSSNGQFDGTATSLGGNVSLGDSILADTHTVRGTLDLRGDVNGRGFIQQSDMIQYWQSGGSQTGVFQHEHASGAFIFKNASFSTLAKIDGGGQLYVPTQIDLGHASDTTISRSSAGVIAVEGVELAFASTGVTWANEATDTSCFIGFATAASGLLSPKTNANMTFNSSTGVATFGQTIVGSVNGNAATATALQTARTIGGTSFDGTANIVPATITVADTTDTTCSVALFESATGDLGPKTDGGLTYNATTGMLTATGLTGPLTGNASTATALQTPRTIGGTSFDGTGNIVPATITVADTTDTTCSVGLWESATGDLGPKTDGGLTYNATTGMLTATGLTGPLTGNASTATALATPRTIGGTSFDGTANIVPATITVADTTDSTCFPALFESATGDLAPKTDGGLTYNASNGTLAATAFSGPLTGNVTGNLTGDVTGTVSGNAGTVTWADEATDTTCFIGFATAASGSLAPKTNANMTFNSNTGVVTFASAVLTTVDANGGTADNVVIGATTPAAITGTTITATGVVTVAAGSAANPSIIFSGSATSGIYQPAADQFGISLGGVVRWAMSSANTMIGTDTSYQVSSSVSPALQIHGATTSSGTVGMTNWNTDSQAPRFDFCKSASGSIGSHTVVANSDDMMVIRASGSNGTNFQAAMQIVADVDGAPGAAIPGRLVFFTTTSASTTLTEVMRMDSTQRVLAGPTTPLTIGQSNKVQIAGNATTLSGLSISHFAASAVGPSIQLSKSRSGTTGTNTIAQSGDSLGDITWYGADGTNYDTAAQIIGELDGTPTSNGTDMPGRIRFLTSADGSSTLTERMRIDKAGNVVVGNAAISTSATDGFLYVPTCAGTPTGTPTTYTGMAPIVINTTNNKLYFYSGGAWRDAGP
jgi:hypothetical protein